MVGAPPTLHKGETFSKKQLTKESVRLRKNLISRFKRSVTELDPKASQIDLDRIWEGRCRITASWLSTMLTGTIWVEASERDGQITLWVEHQDFIGSEWNEQLMKLVNETFSQIHQHNDLNQSDIEAFVLGQERRIIRIGE